MRKLLTKTITANPGETRAEAVRRCIGVDAIPRFVREPTDFELEEGKTKYEVHYLPGGAIDER